MPQINADIKERILVSRRAQAVAAVKAGRRVIVLGARPSNLPPGVLRNPLVECWQRDAGLHRRTLPDNAGLVLHTRFTNHTDLHRLSAEAYRRGVEWHNVPFSTGDLWKILQPLVPSTEPPAPALPPASIIEAPLPAPAPAVSVVQPVVLEEPVMVTSNVNGKTRRGALNPFVYKNANLMAPVMKEAERLLDLAQSNPDLQHTTVESLRGAIVKARKAAGLSKPRRRRRTRIVAKPASVNGSSKLTIKSHNADPVLSMIDDCMAGLALAREQYLVQSKELATLTKIRTVLGA